MQTRPMGAAVARRAIPKTMGWTLGTLGTIALLVGVPIVLLGAQAYPPVFAMLEAALHPTRLAHALNGRFSDTVVIELLWGAAWAAWSWLTVCVAVEVIGLTRGRAPKRLPGSRYVQSVAAFLVGASLAVGPPNRHQPPLRLQAVEVLVSPRHDRHHARGSDGNLSIRAQSAVVEGWPVEAPGASALVQTQRTYTVQPGDTLWSIAGDQLGTPLEWRRIADSNYGRPQPEGEQLTDDHWIKPGWVLVIPSDGPGVLADATVAVEAATGYLGADGFPMVPESHPTFHALTGSQRPEADTVTPSTRPSSAHGSRSPNVPILPVGYGLLAAGVVALLDRMRRAQQRRRPPGLRIALPEGDLVELERGLRIAADPGAAEWVNLSLRLLSGIVRRSRKTPPPVVALRLRDDVVELILDPRHRVDPPPSPFQIGPGENSWVLTRSGDLIDTLRQDGEVTGSGPPLPALVTLGRDEWGLLVANIERAGSIAVSGDGTEPLIQSIATELATSAWADQIDLVLVGFGDEVEGLERVSHSNSLSAIAQKLERRVNERRALLALGEYATNAETRWLESGDAWDLCIVVCAPTKSAGEHQTHEWITELTGDGSLGVIAVLGEEVPTARWHVRAENGRVHVHENGVAWPSASTQRVPSNLIDGVNSLVSVASINEGVDPQHMPYGALSIRTPGDRPKWTEERVVAAGEHECTPGLDETDGVGVEVQVLGRVEINGAARPFTRAWAVELIVYLAMHPGGVSNDRWATALWPDKAMAPASLHSTASAARRSLGAASSGDDHLPRARGRLALGPGVRSDWDRFVDLSRSKGPDDWRTALALVRGMPFDGLRSPDWALLEGILATIEAVVVDVACQYAEHCLLALDAVGAEWAARQGLRVSPYDERLYRILLRSAEAAGNPAGVESIMKELVHLVAEDVEPFDAVHPETLDLYRRLSRRSFVARAN